MDKMALIQSIFIDSKEKALSITDFDELNNLLLNNDAAFISIAYEAASMGIAIKSIQNNNTLDIWSNFYQKHGLKHATQVHVGLGWALSELNLDVSDYLDNLEPMLKYRIIDGFAYYDGKFKRRQAVRMQQIPENLDDLSIRAYNQGLGRSFWYLAQGEPEKLIRFFEIFPETRHFDMWRGIGVAVAYVGGIETTVLEKLIQNSGKHINAFKSGIAIGSQTKEKADAVSIDTENICQFILGLSTTEVDEKLNLLEKELSSSPETIYFDWIKNIEHSI